MKIGPRRSRSLIQPLLIHGFLILVAFTCVFPLAWMVSSALKTQQTVFSDFSLVPDQPNWQNFSTAWTTGEFGIYFFNSVFYTVSVVLGVTLVSSLAAYGFARLRFPGRTALYFMFLAAMMVPLPGSFVPLYVMLVKLALDDTRLGYILALINTGLSLSIYMLKIHFDQMPKELEDAARMDGCSKLRIWWHVALPLAKPVVSVVVIINALNVWNEYLLAMIIFTSRTLMPLQRGLMVFQGTHLTQYPLLMAGMTISVVPAILGYLLMQKYIVRGVTAGALVG
jgi:raffinose/stachyose/melibiose transport system permease protein